MRAADEQNATVVTITAAGRIFVGVETTEAAALSGLSGRTIYIKADVPAPYQKVLTVLDACAANRLCCLVRLPKMRRGRDMYHLTA